MKLLATAISGAEARLIADLADLIDVKDPSLGSLGAPDPGVVRDIRSAIGPFAPLSAALGELDFADVEGAVALAQRFCACGATLLKVGLSHISKADAVEGLIRLKRAVDGKAQVAAAAYADGDEFGFFPCSALASAAREAGLDGMMLDTFTKTGGKSLLDFISVGRAREIIDEGKSYGLATALAGGLKIDHMDRIARIAPDWIGFRGAITLQGEREKAGIDRSKVEALKGKLRRVSEAAI